MATWVYGTVNKKSGEKQEEGHEIILEVMDMFSIFILVMVSETYFDTYIKTYKIIYFTYVFAIY